MLPSYPMPDTGLWHQGPQSAQLEPVWESLKYIHTRRTSQVVGTLGQGLASVTWSLTGLCWWTVPSLHFLSCSDVTGMPL